ncbi:MAG TPA: glutamate synthase-related protein, partial [Thermodesulfovibrionales bacterium]|nr:glutamate synthase-related protein [Thermodesulfovibrionales bacterium]
SLDRIIELLMLAGYSPEHALMLCIPPAWETSDLSEEEKSFFEYQSLRMKPWDGPAAVAFTDGNTVGAHLDRNGLRPLRYAITEDGILVLGSETGMIDLGDRTIREKGRLGPGDTLSVNLQKGRVACTEDVIREIISQKPYRKWIERSLTRLGKVKTMVSEPLDDTRRRQAAFGYTMEEIDTSIKTMTETAKELIFSMGDDTPLPPLSGRPPLLFRYFKQRFSQVTNPPIDPIRERMVMSLRMNLGHKRNFLIETEEHARRLSLDSPILLSEEMKGIEEQAAFKIERIPLTYSREEFGEELQGGDLMTCCAPGRGFDSPLSFAVRRLQKSVEEAVRKGVVLLLLSDRDISKERIAIPSLLAIAASFDHLRRKHLANRVSFIIETGEAREIHHMACLIGYGASAVYPYLAYETIEEMCARGTITIPFPEAVHNYKKALEDGLLKVIARMGISTINSYHAAALFDALCLNKDFVDAFFGDTSISIESDGLAEIEDSLMKRHEAGFAAPEPVINQGGDLLQRKEGEWHAWSPLAVAALNRFVRSGDYRLYREFSRLADERPVFIRHLLTHKKGGPVPLEEVEAEEEILKRFFSGAMSVGALSPEAHETIAEACNALGIKSNSGEGGEDPLRYWSPKNSAIKQIASGRFGVTPTYVASARDLEIKIAQGAKPGEGGHLPENKVTEYIAMLRHCSPSTLLISPPPHHDIYSIEDLAQLIHDLKQANPEAKVCVKLVSEKGVGTVAAGVAKSYADIVQISGCEGGTGASPIGSIKNAGDYWETGLAETQAILIENGLRGRVRLRVDGGLRTGKDVIIAALLGAEEFGFGTATMIATGCVMARKCHLN